jgi:hypothetical protein
MAQCQFCGGENKEIHPGSADQYGEPVCTDCFQSSYTPDPDSSSDFQAVTYGSQPPYERNDAFAQKEARLGASRTGTFHSSHMLHRGLLEEQEDEYGGGSEPDYEGISEARAEKRAERWNYKDVW